MNSRSTNSISMNNMTSKRLMCANVVIFTKKKKKIN